MRRATLVVALASVLTACGAAPTVTRTPDSFASSVPTDSATATRTAEPSEPALAAPGRPFDADAILAAMRDSRRPGGVPDELETEAVASALAEEIWTFDGRAWTTMAASGSCAGETCTLELAGTRPGSQGDDLWTFQVRPADGTVTVTMAELRGLPNELLPSLDALARSLVPDEALAGLLLTNARWLPPPDEGQFELAYRGDGEEGSCIVDVRLDAVAETVVADPSGDC